MSFESKITADGRRLLRSPLGMGTVVTLFLIAPTLIIPGIPLWISLATLVTVGPMIVLACYLLYGWLFDSAHAPTDDGDRSPDAETPFDLLKRRYANGEIDEETFEHRLERLLETEKRTQQIATHKQADETISARNQ